MDGKYNNWKVIDINDQNGENGFYGCLIDTGDGNAIAAFRGSEDASDKSNLMENIITMTVLWEKAT